MSKSTKRKYVAKEVLEDYYVPENNEVVAKILGGRGNNLHEVLTQTNEKYLVSMPTKFRKNVWVKRGDFVVISPIKEGVKVQGEIVHILYPKQVKYLKNQNLWPETFSDITVEETVRDTDVTVENAQSEGEHSDSDDTGDELFANPNHQPIIHAHDDTSSEEEEISIDED